MIVGIRRNDALHDDVQVAGGRLSAHAWPQSGQYDVAEVTPMRHPIRSGPKWIQRQPRILAKPRRGPNKPLRCYADHRHRMPSNLDGLAHDLRVTCIARLP